MVANVIVIGAVLAVLLLCTFVPAVSLWLPKALGY